MKSLFIKFANYQAKTQSNYEKDVSASESPSISSIDTACTQNMLLSQTITTLPIEPSFAKSIHLNFNQSLMSNKLTNMPFTFNPCHKDENLIELESIDLRSLSKKERRKLKARNPKYLLNWKLDNDSIKPNDFGHDWSEIHRSCIRSEWERMGHLAGNSNLTDQ